MKQFDELQEIFPALIQTLDPGEQDRCRALIRRTSAAIRRMETTNANLLRERASIHALLKKTSDDLIHRYQTIFENSGTAMVVIEDDGTVSLVNSVFELFSGYSRQEVEYQRTFASFFVPADQERVMSYHRARRQGASNVPRQYETQFVRRDGRVLDVVTSAQVFPGTLQSIASILDFSERKRSEEALRLANTKLNILSSLSRHDILNLITALGAYLEISREQTTDPKLLEYIEKEMDTTLAITNLILFTKDYQEIGIRSPEWQDLKKTIARAVEDVGFGNVRFLVAMEDVEIFADPLFVRVFYNIVDNALRYGKTLTQIRISFIRSPGGGGIVVCEDDGVGIPLPEKENIFQRKYFQHTGLGLNLSREILSITGIAIAETGEQGNGARFEIAVPDGAWRLVAENR